MKRLIIAMSFVSDTAAIVASRFDKYARPSAEQPPDNYLPIEWLPCERETGAREHE